MNTHNEIAIRPASTALTFADHLDHFLARCGVRRGAHRVELGLYAVGSPTSESPVFVTANYTLSFDALRAGLPGVDGYILVLDTQGINVWCAAGKGTFGTDELVHRIETTGLAEVVRHRRLILPQLGAPGVAAHEVKKRTGFKVEYGPVRAADLLAYLRAHEATPDMRRVRFALRDRLAVVPVEIVHGLVPLVIAMAVAYLFGGFVSAGAAATAILAGIVLFPILLPWLPTRDFSTKGFVLGLLAALPFAVLVFQRNVDLAWWLRTAKALTQLLIWPSVTAFLALNFTGSTTFTSRTGVRREIFAYIPVMAWMFGGGFVLSIVLSFVRSWGGA